VLDALVKSGFEKEMSDISNIPDTTVTLDVDKTTKALKLVERLEDLDDVQAVSTNLEIPDDFELEE
jgi:transcriptional/translational regulatory protein YebC/TACO1